MQYLSLHVRGFNMNRSDFMQQLNDYFSQFGEVKNVKITQSGAALVSFNDRDCARKAKE